MRELRDATEDEMVIAYLQAELASPRWRTAITEGRDGFKLDNLSIITTPNVNDATEQRKRRETLGSYRGFGRNTYAFNGFPSDVRWVRAVASVKEVGGMRLMKFDEAVRLSNGTRIVRDAAANVDVVDAGDLNGYVRRIAASLDDASNLQPLITVAIAPDTDHVFLEGNTRAIAYVLQRSPNEDVDVIAGYTASADQWCFY